MTTKEQLEKLVLGNRFIQSPRLQKLYKELLDRLEAENKQCDINGVSRSLPKVCTGCGHLSTKVIDKKYLACCPDSNYIPMEDYVKFSIYKPELKKR